MTLKRWKQLLGGVLLSSFILVTQIHKIPIATFFLESLEGYFYDQLVYVLAINRKSPAFNVAIIDIDEESIAKEGRWPWPRDKLAKLLKILKNAGVVVSGLDIVMAEPEINYALALEQKIKNNPLLKKKLTELAPLVDNDAILAKTIKSQEVVLGFLFHDYKDIHKGLLPQPLKNKNDKPLKPENFSFYNFLGFNGSNKIFVNNTQTGGFVSNFPDSDGTIRHTLSIGAYKNKLYPSLALAVAMRYLMVDDLELLVEKNTKIIKGFKLDDAVIKTNHLGQFLIPFYGPAISLNYYSATDILQKKTDISQLNGAIAIIGSSMILFSDLHKTPVATLFPGVEMVGNIVAGIVNKNITTEFSWKKSGKVIFLSFGIILSLIFSFISISTMLIVCFILIVVFLILFVASFIIYNLYIPVTPLILATLSIAIFNYIYKFISVSRQKNKISNLFGQYVPKDYVKELLEYPQNYLLEGSTRDMSVLFADIRNFTSISEKLNAKEVKKFLNTFFTPVTEIIFEHQGTIDKYVGDMIVAFWGAPLVDKNHKYNAIATCLEIMHKLPAINKVMQDNNLPLVKLGIGLSSGLMDVGDMGSEFRRAYTVLGDTVNLGSRLQDLTKFYKVDILVNQAAKDKGYVWRKIDTVAVKGRKNAVAIYEPITAIKNLTPELELELASYNQALELYYKQKFSPAIASFKSLQQSHPQIYVYKLYQQRAEEFLARPPAKTWSGVFIHTTK